MEFFLECLILFFKIVPYVLIALLILIINISVILWKISTDNKKISVTNFINNFKNTKDQQR